MDPQERIRELSQLIAALPISNYTLLRALTAHLILIVQNAHINKMTMRNVGIVFSPTLGIPAGVFSLMLAEFNRVFNVDADNDGAGQEEGGDAKSSEPLDPMRRNSRQYSEHAADQYLGLTGRSLIGEFALSSFRSHRLCSNKSASTAPPPSTSASEGTQSDGDDYSESGTEYTEGEGVLDSSASSSPVQGPHEHQAEPPDTPIAAKATSKASTVAASKGLNLTVTGTERGNRHSRLMGAPIGLPLSPRPMHSPSRQGETASSSS